MFIRDEFLVDHAYLIHVDHLSANPFSRFIKFVYTFVRFCILHGSRFLTAVGTLHGPMCTQRSPTYVRAYVRDRGGTYVRTYVRTAVAEDVAYL